MKTQRVHARPNHRRRNQRRAPRAAAAVAGRTFDGHLAARHAVRAWVAIIAALVVVDGIFAVGRVVDLPVIAQMFDFSREDGIGTWFASVLTLSVGVAALALAWAKQNRRWGLVGLLFAYLAFDDGAEIHERVSTGFGLALRDADRIPAFVEGMLTLLPSYVWHALFGPVLLVAGIALAVFLHREIRAPRARAFVILAIGLVFAAVGLDYLEGLDKFQGYGRHYAIVIEEAAEMGGMTLMLAAFLDQLNRSLRDVELRFG